MENYVIFSYFFKDLENGRKEKNSYLPKSAATPLSKESSSPCSYVRHSLFRKGLKPALPQRSGKPEHPTLNLQTKKKEKEESSQNMQNQQGGMLVADLKKQGKEVSVCSSF